MAIRTWYKMLPYNQGERMLKHTKMLPECRNVTKQNCVTLWETDPDGKQVRSLNDWKAVAGVGGH